MPITTQDPICNVLNNTIKIKWNSPIWVALSLSSIAWGMVFKKNIFGWNVGPFHIAVGLAGLGAAAYQQFICKT